MTARFTPKVALVHPPTQGAIVHPTDRNKFAHQGCFPPLALLQLATNLRATYGSRVEVAVLDAQVRGWGIDRTADAIREAGPDLVGIAAWTAFWPGVYETLKLLRRDLPAAHLSVGGHHALIYPQVILQTGLVDSVIVGDGETPLVSLVAALAAGHKPSGPGLRLPGGDKPISAHIERDLDAFPIPDRTLVPWKAYRNILNARPTTSLMTARGCPYRCIYCNNLYPYYRPLGIERVVEEFRSIASLGIRDVEVFDGTFNVSRDRVVELANNLARQNLSLEWSCRLRPTPLDSAMLRAMRQAGCRRVHIGLETARDQTLESLGRSGRIEESIEAVRAARRAGMFTVVYVLLGLPGEDEEDYRTTMRRAHESGTDMVHVSVLTLYPDTLLYAKRLSRGEIERDMWEAYTLDPRPDFQIPLSPTPMGDERLIAFQTRALRRFYLRPSALWRLAKRIRSWNMLVLLVRMGLGIVRNRVR